MDLNYRLIISDKIRQKLVARKEKDPDFKFIIDLEKILKTGKLKI